MSSTTSPLAALGAQVPPVRSVPPRVEPDEDSPGALAAELAASAGLHLDDWQRAVLLDAMAQRDDGRWAAREVALIVPRQNGKGSVLEALELAALFLPEPDGPPPLVLHSAHEYKTADEHFRRMRDLIEGSDRLRKQLRIVRTASGAQAIELHSGARLRFVTRTSGSGRGFSADVVVMDEAYNLSDESMAAVLPTLSARPNPQLWYTSSAGMASSSVLERVRRRGREGGDRQLAYFEWCAADGADLDDREAWAQANPALGIRIDVESVEGERAAMPPEQFGRERLGLWADRTGQAAIDAEQWMALADPKAERGTPCFAVAVAPDHSWSAVAVAWLRPDGRTQVMLADYRRGDEWLDARVARSSARHGADGCPRPCRSRSGAGRRGDQRREAGRGAQQLRRARVKTGGVATRQRGGDERLASRPRGGSHGAARSVLDSQGRHRPCSPPPWLCTPSSTVRPSSWGFYG